MFKKFNSWAALALAMSLTWTAAYSESAAQVIEVQAPVIDSQITKNDSAQIFMQLKNKGLNNYELIAATSPAATKIQFHEAASNSKPEKIVRNIALPKNSEKDLQLGGVHVVLMGLKKSLVPGEAVPLTLIFSDGSWTTVNATVN